MTVEVIGDLSAFQELETEWTAFVSGVEHVTPFQLPAWQLTWWKHFGSGLLHVLVFRESGAIVGIVPCFLHEWEGRRQLTLIGAGISDYLEPVLKGPEAVDQLQKHLEWNRDWDFCSFQDLSASTPFRTLKSTEDVTVAALEDMECSEITLNIRFEEVRQNWSTDLRRNVRRYSEKAAKAGSVQFELIDRAESEYTEALIRLHTARWHAIGQPGMIDANRSGEFLADVIQAFDRSGMVRFFSMRFEGRIVALIVSFPYRNVLYSYMSAFDPEHQEFGFGRALLSEALRYGCESGYSSWNFLRGNETYKSWWGARRIPKCRVTVSRKCRDIDSDNR